eukprot:6007661-Prymnesium_polylepis.1
MGVKHGSRAAEACGSGGGTARGHGSPAGSRSAVTHIPPSSPNMAMRPNMTMRPDMAICPNMTRIPPSSPNMAMRPNMTMRPDMAICPKYDSHPAE